MTFDMCHLSFESYLEKSSIRGFLFFMFCSDTIIKNQLQPIIKNTRAYVNICVFKINILILHAILRIYRSDSYVLS